MIRPVTIFDEGSFEVSTSACGPSSPSTLMRQAAPLALDARTPGKIHRDALP